MRTYSRFSDTLKTGFLWVNFPHNCQFLVDWRKTPSKKKKVPQDLLKQAIDSRNGNKPNKRKETKPLIRSCPETTAKPSNRNSTYGPSPQGNCWRMTRSRLCCEERAAATDRHLGDTDKASNKASQDKVLRNIRLPSTGHRDADNMTIEGPEPSRRMMVIDERLSIETVLSPSVLR